MDIYNILAKYLSENCNEPISLLFFLELANFTKLSLA